MNSYQRAYYETLSRFAPAEPQETPSPTVHTGGQAWRWKCAGCGSPCIGEPVSRKGNRWYCFCQP